MARIPIVPLLGPLVGLAGLALIGTGCKNPDAALLTVSGDAPAAYYDLYVRDDMTQDTVFHSGFTSVSKDTTIDITKGDQPLKIALTLDGGHDREFTFLLVGAIDTMPSGSVPDADKQMFWAGRTKIGGTAHINARLLKVDPGQDMDRDLWPSATTWPGTKPEALTLYAATPYLLDCADAPMPSLPTFLMPNQINPFAKERCADMFDTDCNGSIVMCGDVDKDGDPSDTDCDDNDPKRHHANAMDPYPDPPNCCGYSLGKTGAEKSINYLYAAGDPNCKAASCVRDAMLCPSQRCGDGVDESCSNMDTACIVDNDCDGYTGAADCDDNDPTTYRGAPETCADTKDKNCDGKIGAGCVPCDLDGDGYERLDAANNCNPAADKIDCNDYDSSIHPGSTLETTPVTGASNMGSGKEGGTSLVTAVIAALRGTCRHYYDNASMHPKIAGPPVKNAGIIGDADCNGVAYEGCPSAVCDADGDGYPNSGAGCAIAGVATDCDDTNPTIFPNAPDKCGDGIISNCGATDTVCPGVGTDKDGDGYFGTYDCDDMDPNTHPFAIELCDGKDNDCDGLIDEGNPDGLGVPLVTAGTTTACTTSNVGDCANTKGACVCSKAATNSHYEPVNRTFCPTEVEANLGKGQPECYGSQQPAAFQSCDATKAPHDDDCDGSNEDPTGTHLKETGQACGPTAVGTCMPGTIVGCKVNVNNCFTGAFGADATKAWFVCSSAAVCPKGEVCNGLDDDCNGNVPANEADVDGDKFLACSPTVAPLKGGILGGGDCNDINGNIYPGAPELCNNQIDDCNLNANGTANPHGDGVGPTGQCMGATPDCCSLQMACKNLSTDFNNCNGCANACSAATANSCGGSTGCRCGNGPACTPSGTFGRQCSTISNPAICIDCNTDSKCGPTCAPCGAKHCKADGSQCVDCNVDTDCATNQYCNNNTCVADLNPGQTCTRNEQCSQFCTPIAGGTSVCCNVAVCGGCKTCASGTCNNVTVGNDPNNVCTASSATCQADNCSGNNNCNAAMGVSCATPSCTSGTLSVSTCGNFDGSCNPSSAVCPGNMACSSMTTCRAPGLGCAGNDANCASGFVCSTSNTCIAKQGDGSGCGADKECTNAHCVCSNATCSSSICCASGCSTTCQICAAGGGSCQNSGNGNQGPSCNNPGDACDGSNMCKRSDGALCPGGSGTCLSGKCLNRCCSSACSPTCSDSADPSTLVTFTSCNGAGTCGGVTVGAACGTGLACNGDVCNTTCTGSGAGGSGNGCKTGYHCNGSGMCLACTDTTNCGSSCGACGVGANLCTGGACKCGANPPCSGAKPTCNAGTCQ